MCFVKINVKNADILHLIKIAECTLIAAPRTAFYPIANTLEPKEAEDYKKAVEAIEQKFCSQSMKIMPFFIQKHLYGISPYSVLVDNVKKNIQSQSKPREDDPDMYLTARIGSFIYNQL